MDPDVSINFTSATKEKLSIIPELNRGVRANIFYIYEKFIFNIFKRAFPD